MQICNPLSFIHGGFASRLVLSLENRLLCLFFFNYWPIFVSFFPRIGPSFFKLRQLDTANLLLFCHLLHFSLFLRIFYHLSKQEKLLLEIMSTVLNFSSRKWNYGWCLDYILKKYIFSPHPLNRILTLVHCIVFLFSLANEYMLEFHLYLLQDLF